MNTDIANWLQVNIVNNPQVLKSLIALIILIVASFLFSEKPTEKIPFRRVLGAFLFVFAIFAFLYANIADLADVFTVWATLVLAGVAVLSFEESRRLRKQYKEREERDRKERLLKEIIDWANAITEFTADQIVTDRANESTILTGAANRLRELNGLSVTGVYIESIAPRLFPNNTDLLRDIHNFRLRIKQYCGFLILVVEKKVKQIKEEKAAALIGRRLQDDAINLIQLATRMYTEIK